MKWRVQILLLILLPLKLLTAQSDSLKSVEYILNNFINSAEIEKEDSELYDLIEYYLDEPIDLNSASKSDIMKLPFANIDEANLIIKYRNSNGKIFSYGELKSIENISVRFIELLQLFTYLKKGETNFSQSALANYDFKIRSRINYNFKKKEGYKTGYFVGSPLKIYNRVKLNAHSKVLVGALFEKDAGDKSYFDFYSYYIQVNNLFSGLSILAGYYTMEFGQGLAMWSPYSFSKSSDATNSIIKRARGTSPYASAGEYSYLTGMAIKYKSKYLSITPFYSIEDEDYFSSNKNTFGISLSVTPIENINISTFYYQQFQKASPNLSSLMEWETNKYLSFAYDANYNNLFITGEFSIYKNSVASINTLQLSIHNNFLLIASIRNYPNTYKSYYAKGFGETNRTNNEFGVYFGVKWKTQFGIINFYLDQFKFPNKGTAIPLPSNGNEISASYSFKPIHNGNLFFRYFNEKKDVLELMGSENKIITRTTNKLRSEFSFQLNRVLRLKSRIELLHLSKSKIGINENGLLLFQDFQYKIKSKITVYGRIIFFQTDSFASRIYEFENDLIGVMTNQPLWGSGIKFYLLLRYNPFGNFNVSAKYSELYKPNETSLGSGYNLIKGNLENKISLQIDYSF
ncbi:MAG: helix-hairpin-helix domain-containing protein [Melioribacteraceae bacterium]|nr:helix-hairpin-helix domain-containing protein [Melioribacteraceae bacterium]